MIKIQKLVRCLKNFSSQNNETDTQNKHLKKSWTILMMQHINY